MIKLWAFLIMIAYYDDLEFLDGAVVPGCTTVLTNHVAASYSLEFIRSGRLHLRHGHGAPVVLNEPAVFWHRPQLRYDYGAYDEAGWDHHWLTFRGARGQRLVEQGFDQLAANGCGYLMINDPIELSRRFEQLIALIPQRSASSHQRAVCLMEELLMIVAENQVRPDADQACRLAMESLCQTMQRQPSLEIDFAAEARRLNMSYSHFRRRFKQTVGRSPHDYLLMARMYRAARQLMHRDLGIKQIAAAVGYDDPGQFARMFKRIMGLSPLKYREGMPRYAHLDEQGSG